jgi:translation initiation factor IF-2
MSKVRVYELAREAGMSSKVLTDKLLELGYDIKGHSSSVDAETADKIRNTVLKSVNSKLVEKRIESEAEEKKGKTVVHHRATVIRRRAKKVEPEKPVLAEAKAEKTKEIPEEEVSAPALETLRTESKKVEVSTGSVDQAPAPVKGPAVESPEAVKPVAEKTAVPPAPKKEAAVATASAESIEDKEVKAAPVDKEVKAAPIDKEMKAAPVVEAVAPETTTVKMTATEKKVEEKPATPGEGKPVEKKVAEKNLEIPPPRKGAARILRRIELPAEPAPRPKKKSRPSPRPNSAPRPSSPGRPSSPSRPSSPGGRPSAPGPTGGAPGNDSRGKRKGKKGGFNEDRDQDRRNKRGGKNVKYTHFGPDYGETDGRGRRRKSKKNAKPVQLAAEMKASKRKFTVYESLSVGDLALNMKVKAGEIISKLMGMGVMATINQQVDYDTSVIIASEFDYEVEQGITEEIGLQLLEESEEGGSQKNRPPIVTVMGHVDHGKTSILDAIRKSDVAEGEAGGITQHIGAYNVRSAAGNITFVDTPGHAAFTEMRSRGAQVTDIIVLVVAADDGVMDQTKEAIAHAKAADVPIIVAVNKIDKDNADIERVKRELSELNLMPEDWGGDTMFVETSAKKNIGIDTLLESIMLLAEVLELHADANRKARGRVVEAQLHKGRGAVATVLILDGTLRTGDYFVVGQFSGKVRSMLDDRERRIEEAGPSIPVEVQGLSGVPSAGDEFIVVPGEKMARSVSQERSLKVRESDLAVKNRVTFENLFDQMSQGDIKELRVVLRSDVQGTLQAFAKAAEDLSTDEIKVKVLHEGTGAVTESDILLASASDAIIIGFNVRPSIKVKELAVKEGVEVRSYDVIYHALDDLKKAMVGMLDPSFEEEIIGTAEVRDVFSVPKVGSIGGCFVLDGKMQRGAGVRVLRDGVVVYTGKIESLKRFKDDAKEVASGYECGIGVEKFNDIKVGDLLEAFIMNEVEATL